MSLHLEIAFVGKVIEVRPPVNTARGAVQEILVKRPKFVHGNTINDKYPVIFFGNQINEFDPESLYGKWINIILYVNGKSYPDENGNAVEKVVLSVKDLKVFSK